MAVVQDDLAAVAVDFEPQGAALLPFGGFACWWPPGGPSRMRGSAGMWCVAGWAAASCRTSSSARRAGSLGAGQVRGWALASVSYEIVVKLRARKAFLSLDRQVRKRVGAAIDGLAAQPRPRRAKALAGMTGVLRIRVGDYRILYEVHDGKLVLVIDVGHRRQCDQYPGSREAKDDDACLIVATNGSLSLTSFRCAWAVRSPWGARCSRRPPRRCVSRRRADTRSARCRLP